MRIDLIVHISAGAIGILSGYIALAAAKGATVHRRSGMVFVYAMWVMALMGTTIALLRNVAPAANAPMGLMTAYLIATGLTTVKPPSAHSRAIDLGLLLVVLAVTATLLTFGVRVLASPSGRLYGMPAAPFLIFGSVALLACVGDMRLIRAGGIQTLHGAARLARHLWRMCTAFLIAAFSFFLGQAKVIPKPIRIYPLLMIPPLVVLVTMLYWLWRVRRPRSRTGLLIKGTPASVLRARAEATAEV